MATLIFTIYGPKVICFRLLIHINYMHIDYYMHIRKLDSGLIISIVFETKEYASRI